MGCAPKITPAPIAAAPYAVVYSCEQLRQAEKEYDALPAGSMIRILLDDYHAERKALDGLHDIKPRRRPQWCRTRRCRRSL